MTNKAYNIENDVIQNGSKAYNIENDVIQKWPSKRITSKTMLYKMAPKAYNIENDVILK